MCIRLGVLFSFIHIIPLSSLFRLVFTSRCTFIFCVSHWANHSVRPHNVGPKIYATRVAHSVKGSPRFVHIFVVDVIFIRDYSNSKDGNDAWQTEKCFHHIDSWGSYNPWKREEIMHSTVEGLRIRRLVFGVCQTLEKIFLRRERVAYIYVYEL